MQYEVTIQCASTAHRGPRLFPMTNGTGDAAAPLHIRLVFLDAGNIQRQIGCYPICIRMSHSGGDPVITELLPRIRDSDLHFALH
ncbi:hypothetical protein F5Y13DRAFT_166538 [Hypoxylon sp. FL1857]|nr:hypothetical protein F5Y13DRAFT_166538 [Hypoxylon sp. FL1857]